MTFFASDPEFADNKQWQAFAEAMLIKHRFSFSNNKGLDDKVSLSFSQFMLNILIDVLN